MLKIEVAGRLWSYSAHATIHNTPNSSSYYKNNNALYFHCLKIVYKKNCLLNKQFIFSVFLIFHK